MRLFLGALATASLAGLATPIPRAHAEMPRSGVIDLAQWFPGQMARTHYLAGSQPNTDWHLTDLGGNFFAFKLGSAGGGFGDLYVVFEREIAVLGHNFIWPAGAGDHTIITYLPPFPSFLRYLDLHMLPVERVHPASTAAVQVGNAEPVIQHNPAGRVSITRDGDTVRLKWYAVDEHGAEIGHETLIIGSVPIEGTDGLTAPGLVGYDTHLAGGITTRFRWVPR